MAIRFSLFLFAKSVHKSSVTFILFHLKEGIFVRLKMGTIVPDLDESSHYPTAIYVGPVKRCCPPSKPTSIQSYIRVKMCHNFGHAVGPALVPLDLFYASHAVSAQLQLAMVLAFCHV